MANSKGGPGPTKGGNAAALQGPGRRPRQPKVSEVVARGLARRIVNSHLEEGAALAPERIMAEEEGVGRTTMREALRLLETGGALRIRTGAAGGPVVRRPRPADLSGQMTLQLQFEEATYGDVAATRRMLEPLVAYEAAEHVTPEAIETLREVNQSLLDTFEEPDEFTEGNRRFHGIIAEYCGNVLLRIFTESMLVIADNRSVGILYPKRQVEGIVAAHEKIVDALESGDSEAAADAMRAHLSDADNYWRRRHADRIDRPVEWRL